MRPAQSFIGSESEGFRSEVDFLRESFEQLGQFVWLDAASKREGFQLMRMESAGETTQCVIRRVRSGATDLEPVPMDRDGQRLRFTERGFERAAEPPGDRYEHGVPFRVLGLVAKRRGELLQRKQDIGGKGSGVVDGFVVNHTKMSYRRNVCLQENDCQVASDITLGGRAT
jgi:hypothetical protein